MAGQGAGFRSDALLVAAITHHHIGVVIHEGGAGLVELGGQVGFSDRQTHGVGDAGAQGAGGHFHAGGFKGFGVTGRLGAPLAELLDVVDRHRVVAGEVQQRVQQHAAVTSRQHKAVAVEPLGVLGVVLQKLVPQRITHGCAAHRQAGVAALGLVDGIDRQHPDAVDAERVERRGRSDHGVKRKSWGDCDAGCEPEAQLARLKARQTLWPPKPKELDNTVPSV